MSQIKSVISVFLTKFVGFLIFLVLLGIANTLLYYIQNDNFYAVVGFLNKNIFLIIIFTVILLIGEMFGVLVFPFNLPAPLFNAVGAVLLLKFIFNIFIFLDNLSGLYLAITYNILYAVIAFLVFVIVVIVGYVRIFGNLAKRHIDKKIDKKKIKVRKKHEIEE